MFLRYDFKPHCCMSRNLDEGKISFPPSQEGRQGLCSGPRAHPRHQSLSAPSLPAPQDGSRPTACCRALDPPSVLKQGAGRVVGNGEKLVQPRLSPWKKPCPDTPILPLPGPGESHTPLESKWSRKAISPSGDNLRWNRVPVRRTDIG